MHGLVAISAMAAMAGAAPTCGQPTDTTLVVTWPAVPGCDMYYVELSRGPGQRP